MGTRADFYVGRGAKAKWIGSIAWDGYPKTPKSSGGISRNLLKARTEWDFCEHVAALEDREDFTKPEMGWPWLWDDSGTTDYAYAFDKGRVWASSFGDKWQRAEDLIAPDPVFPDMSARRSAAIGTERDSVMVISRREP